MTTLTRILDGNRTYEVKDNVSMEQFPDESIHYRELDARPKKDGCLCAYDLFSLFTANIIVQNVTFTR